MKMNEIQKKTFDILKELDRVCKEAGLKYFIYAGTLLGAVRHKGYIPWDDDIDVVMFRADYEKLVEACKKYLNHNLFELQTIYSDPMANNPWMKLHDKNTAFISGIRREGSMEGINIDIFPIDNAPDTEKQLNKTAKYFDNMNFVYQWRFANSNEELSNKIRFFQKIIKLIPPFNELKFKERYNKKIQQYNSKSTRNVVYFSNRKYLKKVIPREFFDEIILLDFEGEYFPAPKKWNEILTKLYGPNYMELPPEDQRKTVHGTKVVDLENSWKKYKFESGKYEKI